MDSKLIILCLGLLFGSFIIPEYSHAQTPLPLVWDNIHIKKTTSGNNLIEWGILPEYNIQQFLIQRSMNGRSFSVIKKITVNAGLTNYKTEDYSNSDVYYRIISIDDKGRASYSKIVSAKESASASSVYYDGSGYIRIQKMDNNQHLVRIFDMSGRLLKTQVVNNNYTMIDVSTLSHGMYLVKLSDSDSLKFFK